MTFSNEHRRHPRVPCQIEAEVRSLDQERPASSSFKKFRQNLLKSLVRNVSLGGAFLEANSSIRKGDILRMEFTLPGHSLRFAAFGEVCWSDKTGGGLRFLALAEEGQVALKEYIHDVLRH